MAVTYHRIIASVTDWALLHLCVQTLSNLSRLDETTGIGRVLG